MYTLATKLLCISIAHLSSVPESVGLTNCFNEFACTSSSEVQRTIVGSEGEAGGAWHPFLCGCCLSYLDLCRKIVQGQCAWMWRGALPRVIKNILLRECTTFNFKSLIGASQRTSYRRKGYLGTVEGVAGGCAVCALTKPCRALVHVFVQELHGTSVPLV